MLFQGREWFFAMWKEVVVSQQWHAATLKKLLSDHFHRKAWGCMEKPRKLSRSSFRCTKRHVGNVKCYVIIQLHRIQSQWLLTPVYRSAHTILKVSRSTKPALNITFALFELPSEITFTFYPFVNQLSRDFILTISLNKSLSILGPCATQQQSFSVFPVWFL